MLLFVLAQLALADIPPPGDYVETCTLKNHPGCVQCEGWHGGREDCEALEKKGYTRVCRTGGASVWKEILCGGEGGDPEPSPKVVEQGAKGAAKAPAEAADALKAAKAADEAPDASPAADAKPATDTTNKTSTTTSRCATLAPSSAPAALLLALGLIGLRRRR